MHGQSETSRMPRLVCTLAHAVFLGLAAWIYFGGGGATIYGWFGGQPSGEGNLQRQIILFSFGIILFLRIFFVQFYILQRKFGWEELFGVLFALFLYQLVFAFLGFSTGKPIGLVDMAAVIIFLFGSYLNTGSELQRKKFKDAPNNKGRLYTEGLFRYARHINYFGDILWVTAWAVLTWNIWSAVIPVALTAGFAFFFVPSLTKYLQQHYGEQFEEWEARTKALIPFIH